MSRARFGPPAARGVLGLVLLLSGCSGEYRTPRLVEELEAQRPARSSDDPLTQSRRTAIVEASQRVSSAVVSITVTSRRQTAPQTPFDFFFVPPSPREQQSFGTGFLIRADGVVLTNQHV